MLVVRGDSSTLFRQEARHPLAVTPEGCSRDALVGRPTREATVRELLTILTEGEAALGEDEVIHAFFASAIEHGVMVWSGGKSRGYRRKMTTIFMVLRSSVAHARLLGTIRPWDLAFTREEILMDGSDEARQDEVVDESVSQIEAKLKAKAAKMTDTTRLPFCPKCKSKDLMQIAEQTRSADEGMRYSWLCCICHHKFRVR